MFVQLLVAFQSIYAIERENENLYHLTCLTLVSLYSPVLLTTSSGPTPCLFPHPAMTYGFPSALKALLPSCYVLMPGYRSFTNSTVLEQRLLIMT